jgi:hypothetical protein
MTAADRKQTREMIVDVLAPLIKQIDGRDILMNTTLNNIDGHMEKIDGHLSRLNGKVAEHERIINTVGDERIKGCIQRAMIEELKNNMITAKAVRKYLITTVTVTGTIMSILFILYKVFFESLV